VTRVLRRRRRPQRGFTLVELLMAIALASIFSLALYGFFFAGIDAMRTHESQAKAQSSGRTAIDRFAREARQAVSPDDGLTPPIISVTPTSAEFYYDPSRSASSITPRPQRVRYSVVSGQLVRERATPIGSVPPFAYGGYGAKEVLIDNLQNGATPVFSAVTEKGVAMASTVSGPQARDIAQISVRLFVGQKTGNTATTLELSTDVGLRNAVHI
jgi:prepilin-type N-terminal cleavage/methylation domain-containing protein